MMKYVGIADCHGLESFKPVSDCEENEIRMMDIRALSNDQRHALVYKATLAKSAAEKIKTLLEDSSVPYRYEKALKVLKETAGKLEISKGKEHSWDMIPNRKLDPWNPHGIK